MSIPGAQAGPDRWLVAVAAPREAESVMTGLGSQSGSEASMPPIGVATQITHHMDLVRTGVGKTHASIAVGRIYDPARYVGVLSVGIAGSLPGSGLGLGSVVLGSRCVLADEGVETPSGFVSLDEMGFGDPGVAVEPDVGTLGLLRPIADRVGILACVSTCSGTDHLAELIVERTGAVAEAMEGAACGLAARSADPVARFAELRVISNTTGDRHRQVWALDAALDRLGDVLGRVSVALDPS